MCSYYYNNMQWNCTVTETVEGADDSYTMKKLWLYIAKRYTLYKTRSIF